MIKFIKYFIQSIFIYFFFIMGKILGIKLSRKIFSLVFSKFGSFFRSNEIVKKNLEIFSSNISVEEKNRIIKKMWENYGKTFIEYMFLKKLRENKSNIIIKGEKNLLYIKKNKKPVIFVSGHFANFEMMSMEITKKNIKLATIYRPLNNIFLNPLMEFLRKKYICNNQIKKGINGVRKAIEYLKKDYSVALMIDQRVSEGETINFFNKSALTTTLPAQLSIKFDLEIVPVFVERTKDDNFIIEFFDPINNKKYKDKISLTEALNTQLEKMIIRNPYQWIWTHKRWK
jgi:KDO2-lipid IV(A) lauroyltransferase